MKIKLQELFPIIHIDLTFNKAVLNEKAKAIFDKDEIESIIKKIDLEKKVDFCYIGNKLYVVNIIKGLKNLYLLFSEVEDTSIAFNTLKSEGNIGVDLYQKEVLKEFLEKFLALKRRYGGFNIKFLYLRIDFTLNLSVKIKRQFLHNIAKYMVAVTRSSDVVGQIAENKFGIILTNATSEGANVVASKIIEYIAGLNADTERRIMEVYGCLAHEVFILKHPDFNELVELLDENSEFITVGIKLKEVLK